jgi:hypothetical protein
LLHDGEQANSQQKGQTNPTGNLFTERHFFYLLKEPISPVSLFLKKSFTMLYFVLQNERWLIDSELWIGVILLRLSFVAPAVRQKLPDREKSAVW